MTLTWLAQVAICSLPAALLYPSQPHPDPWRVDSLVEEEGGGGNYLNGHCAGREFVLHGLKATEVPGDGGGKVTFRVTGPWEGRELPKRRKNHEKKTNKDLKWQKGPLEGLSPFTAQAPTWQLCEEQRQERGSN